MIILEEEQYFKFRKQNRCALFIDGNYMLGISRNLDIKLDMEKLFNEITAGMHRFRTYWYAALESTIDRNNNAFRFLDRLKYIPRTKVYSGRLTKRYQGHFESALRTDAGIALALNLVELSKSNNIDYVLLIAGDPEYVPAIRSAQRNGVIVKLVYPENLGELTPHPDLLKTVDERQPLETGYLEQFEYINEYQYEEYISDDESDELDDEIDDDLDKDLEDDSEVVDNELEIED